MNYDDKKARRIEIQPPLPLKQKIDRYAKGERSKFIMAAIKEKIARIEESDRNTYARQ